MSTVGLAVGFAGPMLISGSVSLVMLEEIAKKGVQVCSVQDSRSLTWIGSIKVPVGEKASE